MDLLEKAIEQVVRRQQKELVAKLIAALQVVKQSFDPADTSPSPPPRRTRVRTAAPRKFSGDLTGYRVGATCTYMQGRGQFVAKITKIDAETGFVEVTRISDGKVVRRPADKIVLARQNES